MGLCCEIISSRYTVINKEERKLKEKTTSQTAGASAVDPFPSVESLQLSERLRAAIAARDPNAKAGKLADLTHWARDIEKLIRIAGRRAEDVEKVIGCCQSNGCFWGPNILSGRKLRAKFDTMRGQMKRGGTDGTIRRDTAGKPPPATGPMDPEYEKLVNEKAHALFGGLEL